MYFFDGHNLYYNEDATYGKSWGIKEFMEQWPKDMIIVGIECGHGPGQRLNEYCPYTVDPDTRVYLSWGTKEAWGVTDHEHKDTSSFTYKDNRYVGDVLESQGAAVELHCQVVGGHCEADWEKLVPGFMDFLWMR